MFDDQRRSLRLRLGKRCAPVLTLAAIAVAAPLTAREVTVRRGDTLGGISADTGVSIARIAAYNGIRNPDLIFEGQVLRIPAAEGDVEYVIAPGDTLGAIALRNDTTVAALVARNGLQDPDLIVAGKTLVIPAQGATGAPSAPTTAAPATTAAPRPATPAAAPPVTAPPAIAPPTTPAPTTAPPRTTVAPPPTTTAAPPPTTAAPSSTPTPAPGVVVSTIWLIQQGDTVTSIAGKVGVTPERLAEANTIAVSTPLVPGRYLFVPQR